MLEAASLVFGERGFAGATTDAVAQAAGVSQAYVVRTFGSKKALFAEAAQRALDRTEEAFRSAAAEDEASQAIVAKWEMPREYLGPAEYLAYAKERVEYEKRMVARLKLSID